MQVNLFHSAHLSVLARISFDNKEQAQEIQSNTCESAFKFHGKLQIPSLA